MTTLLEAVYKCRDCGARGYFGPYWNGQNSDGSIDPSNGQNIPTTRPCPWCGGRMEWTGDLTPVD